MDEVARWVSGLRRTWVTGTTLDRWIDAFDVRGVVWTPGGWEPEDAAYAITRLVSDGAAADDALLWDLALADIRSAAASLRAVDGTVAVAIDPDGLVDPGRAVQTARTLVNEVARDNVAVAFAWQGARAGALSAIVASGTPVALFGVDGAQALDAVRRAWEKGMERLRKSAEDEGDDPDDVEAVPVFVLGAGSDVLPQPAEGIRAVEVVGELQLVTGRGPAPVLPSTPAEESADRARGLQRLVERARRPLSDEEYAPDLFVASALSAAARLAGADALERMWEADHTLWKPEPDEIADRLGWLRVPADMHADLDGLLAFGREVREGVNRVVLLGMGGSSLAAETLRKVVGGDVALTVLDTTHPAAVADVAARVDPERTLFVVSSKSGTTTETRTQLEYFWSVVGRGHAFVAVTDPDTELAALARERGFRRTFTNPPDIGGRYSGLSFFGLVPAAACGVDVGAVLGRAVEMMRFHMPSVPASQCPGARLGAAIGDAAGEGRDKLTFVLPPRLASFGDWVEQLVAESTGKEGTGIVPVVGEDLGDPESYRDDRSFVAYAVGDEPFPAALEALEAADHPVVRIRIASLQAVGAEMYRWMVATAVVGYELDINPFDQPDVESAKTRTREILAGGEATAPDRGDAPAILADLSERDDDPYLAIQAFVQPTEDNARRLQRARLALRDRYRVATTVGFGPRFLHSTGQLHKGGPDAAVFLQVYEPPSTDVEVVGAASFARLFAAQADGDLRALRDAERRVARVTLDELDALVGR